MPGRWKAGRASTGFGWRTARAGSMRGEIRDRAMKAAAEVGVGTGSIRRLRAFSGEDRGRRVLEGRGDAPGLVHILSAMESCTSFRHWRDPKTGATTPRPTSGKCPHHYLGCSSTLGRLWFPHAMLCERRALERPGKPACGASSAGSSGLRTTRLLRKVRAENATVNKLRYTPRCAIRSSPFCAG